MNIQESKETGIATDNHVPYGMVLIPSGSFEMGSDQGSEHELPVHLIEIDAFFFDQAFVSNRKFREFIEDTHYKTTAEIEGHAWAFDGAKFQEIAGVSWRSASGDGRDEHPVVYVSWWDAEAFAQWAGKRLPTEAELEYASRGGRERELYPWGNENPTAETCCFGREPKNPYVPPTEPVVSSKVNGFGIHHAVGNVWAWTKDWFAENYYSRSSQKNPKGPSDGVFKVRRGGAWNVIQAFRLRCANRGAVPPSLCAPNVGFRCALSLTVYDGGKGTQTRP